MSATDTTTTPAAHSRENRTTTNRAGFTTSMGLVIEREIMVRLKSKAVMVSTILSIVLFGVLVRVAGALPSLFSSTDKVAVTSAGAKAVEGIDDIEPVAVDDADEARPWSPRRRSTQPSSNRKTHRPGSPSTRCVRHRSRSSGHSDSPPRSNSSTPTPQTRRSPTSSGSASGSSSSWPR